MPLSRVLMWTSDLALLAGALWLWPGVPDRVPLHIGSDGTPTRWGDRSLLLWLAMPLTGLALAAVLEAATAWVVRHPEAPGVNIPNKQALLELPRERRAPVLRRVAATTYGVGAVCLVALALIQVGVWVSSRSGAGSGWTTAGTVVAVVAPLAVVAWGSVRTRAEIRRQQRA